MCKHLERGQIVSDADRFRCVASRNVDLLPGGLLLGKDTAKIMERGLFTPVRIFRAPPVTARRLAGTI